MSCGFVAVNLADLSRKYAIPYSLLFRALRKWLNVGGSDCNTLKETDFTINSIARPSSLQANHFCPQPTKGSDLAAAISCITQHQVHQRRLPSLRSASQALRFSWSSIWKGISSNTMVRILGIRSMAKSLSSAACPNHTRTWDASLYIPHLLDLTTLLFIIKLIDTDCVNP